MNKRIFFVVIAISIILLFSVTGYSISDSETKPAPSSSGFFPIGLYAVDDFYPRSPTDSPSKMTVLEELPEISRAGFNVIQSYRFEVASLEWGNTNENARIFLDAAHKSGLKVIMGLGADWFVDGNPDFIPERVRALKDHPALYGWILYDDLPQGGISEDGQGLWPDPEQLRKVGRAVKAIDASHPLIVAVPGAVDQNYEFRDVTDIYMPDNLPIGFEVIPPGIPQEWESHPEDVGKFIDLIYKAIGPKQKVIAHIQTYNLANDSLIWGDETHRMPQNLGRYPTRAEMRFLAYNALIHKSQGVSFLEYRHHYLNYGRDDGVGGSDTSPRGNMKQWQAMASVASELKVMSPILLKPTKELQQVGVMLDGDSKLEAMAKEYQGKIFLFTANRSPQAVELRIQLARDRFPNPSIELLPKRQQIPLIDRAFTDRWLPYEVRIYQVVRSVDIR